MTNIPKKILNDKVVEYFTEDEYNIYLHCLKSPEQLLIEELQRENIKLMDENIVIKDNLQSLEKDIADLLLVSGGV